MLKKLCFVMIFILLTGCSNYVKTSNSGTPTVSSTSQITSEAANKVNNSVSVSAETEKQPNNENFETILLEYKNYLSSLNKDDIKSVLLGIDNYKKYASDNKSNNDKLFDLFDELYNQCVNKKLDSLDKYLSYSDEELVKYGLVRWENMLIPDESFMYNTFSKYLSKGKVEFLRLSYKESINNYFRDGIFHGTLNDYSDSIIVWENYSKLYDSCPEYKKEAASARETAKDWVKNYVNYNNDLDIPVFQALFEPNDTLSPEAQKSFLRFTEKYPDSAYKKVILDYYNILKSNKFEYNKEAEKYLKSKDLFIKNNKINNEKRDSE